MPVFNFQDGQILTANQLNTSFAAKADAEDPVLTGDVDATGATSVAVTDSTFEIRDNVDPTKKFRFQAGNITAATTKTITVPDDNITLVGAENTQTISGPKTFSGTLTMSGKPINEAARFDVASATTVDLSSVSANYIRITGTNNIAAITLPDGAERTIVFLAGLSLIHSPTFILPGAANITVASGDTIIVRGESGGARVVNFQSATNDPNIGANTTINTNAYSYYIAGGLLVQTGIGPLTTNANGDSGTITFPIAFSVKPNILISPYERTGATPIYSVDVATASSFDWSMSDRDTSGGGATSKFVWFAIGPA